MRSRIRQAFIVELDGDDGEVVIDVDHEGQISITDRGERLADLLAPDEVWALAEALQDAHRLACSITEQRADEREIERRVREGAVS